MVYQYHHIDLTTMPLLHVTPKLVTVWDHMTAPVTSMQIQIKVEEFWNPLLELKETESNN